MERIEDYPRDEDRLSSYHCKGSEKGPGEQEIEEDGSVGVHESTEIKDLQDKGGI